MSCAGTVRIYRPTKSAMQSGGRGAGKWMLEFKQKMPLRPESLMGWTSNGDTMQQIRLFFASIDEAKAYAERCGFAAVVDLPNETFYRPRSYADNFRTERIRG